MTDPRDTEIARYNLTGYDRGTEAAHEGAWVRHSDHAAEIARLHQQWEDQDAAWSERVALLTAALAESEAAAEGALMILVQTQAERDAALAQVAGAFYAAAEFADEWDTIERLLPFMDDKSNACAHTGQHEARERIANRIRALTPADALAALDRIKWQERLATWAKAEKIAAGIAGNDKAFNADRRRGAGEVQAAIRAAILAGKGEQDGQF